MAPPELPSQSPHEELMGLWTEIRDLLRQQNANLKIQNEEMKKLRVVGSTEDEPHNSTSVEPGDSGTEKSAQVGQPEAANKDHEDTLMDGSKLDSVEPRHTGLQLEAGEPETAELHDAHRTVYHRDPLRHERTSTLIAGPDWKYWVLKPQGFQKQTGRGFPDYLPEWEIFQSDGVWYHVDGTQLDPQTFQGCDPQVEFDEEERMVPYSLTPWTWTLHGQFSGWKPEDGSSSSSTYGLVHHQKRLRESLGLLYSIPPDQRVGLRFGKEELRMASESGFLDSYLDATHNVLTHLYNNGGMFKVTDLDDFMNMATYEWHPSGQYGPLGSTSLPVDDPRFLAEPALQAEELNLNIPPSRCIISKISGTPVNVSSSRGGRWYRVISCEGASSVAALKTESDQPFWKLILSGHGRAIKFPYLENMFVLHLHCHHRTDSGNPFLHEWRPFHITWFRISLEAPNPEQNSTWKSGTLYGSPPGAIPLSIGEVAFTMRVFPEKDPMDLSEGLPYDHMMHMTWSEKRYMFSYWTVIYLAPSHFHDHFDRNLKGVPKWGRPHTVVVYLIRTALRDAADSWEQIANYLSVTLQMQDSVLHPDEHDRLLFDDSTFSRSRLYFWAADVLDVFINSILRTIREWDNFWEARRDFFQTAGKYHESYMGEHSDGDSDVYLNQFHDGVTAQINRLRQLHGRLVALRDQTHILRDGLFNASAVIESRAATELGKNVRLLTYVSIFYLPLNFAAALWSMNRSYSMSAFAITTVCLGIGTYIVVINLRNLVSLGKSGYRRVRNPAISAMAKDPHGDWASIGTAFSHFKPERKDMMPSEWYIPLFFLSAAWRRFIKIFMWKRAAKSEDNGNTGPQKRKVGEKTMERV